MSGTVHDGLRKEPRSREHRSLYISGHSGHEGSDFADMLPSTVVKKLGDVYIFNKRNHPFIVCSQCLCKGDQSVSSFLWVLGLNLLAESVLNL